MSKILGISTSSGTTSAAVAEDRVLLSESTSAIENRQAEYLALAVRSALDLAGCTVADIEAVAVDVGPGTYTGLRAGIAAAKAFCLARDLPLIPVPSLWALHTEASACLGEALAVVTDARRKEVFWQLFPPQPIELASALEAALNGGPAIPDDLQRALGIDVARPEQVAEDLSKSAPEECAVVLVGEGATRYADVFVTILGNRVRVVSGHSVPRASSVCALAQQLVDANPALAGDPDRVGAVYLRKPDVTAPKRRHDSLIPAGVLV
jgi:tRNA threonylcarbamoyl adenosine modification protein YeaZ